MRSKRFIISICFLALSGVLYIADRQGNSGRDKQEELEVLLRQHNSAAFARLEKNFLNADRLVQDILDRFRRKDDSYEFLLQLTDAPKQLIFEGKRLKAFDFRADPALFAAMERHIGSKDPYAVYSKDGKSLILVAGEFGKKSYVASYDKDTLLGGISYSSGFRTWVASASGIMLFHPQARYLGADMANFKPVASGVLAIQDNRRQELVSNYVGLEGGDILGVWVSVPGRAFIVGTEWSRDGRFFQKKSGDIVHYLFLLSFALGMVILGVSIGGKNISGEREENYQFDLERLNAESREFLQQAKITAETALEFRAQLESDLKNAQEQAKIYHRDSQDSLSCLDLWNTFAKALVESVTGKQVWQKLIPVFSSKLMGSTVVFYRFSETSFALVPEEAAGLNHLEASAQLYLADARIFLGDFKKIPDISKSQAFQNWDSARKRHMPLIECEAFFIPIEGNTTSRGAILFLVHKDLVNAELLRKLQYFEDFVERATPLCELKNRLLQSKNAKLHPGKALAGPSNHA